ncbi:hypothetical protein JCM14076_06810 [Methylosoma difficile]
MDIDIQQLAQTELFFDAPEEVLYRVLAHTSLMVLDEGEVLLSPDRDNHHVYLLISGRLALHFGALDSPEIRVLEKGVSVGELSIIDQVRPSAFVVAKENCHVLPVHRDFIQTMISDCNPIARNMLKLLSGWIKANTECIVTDKSIIGELTNHANIDALTGLYNRRWLDNTLQPLLAQGIENRQPLCLLLADIDRFKNYNDAMGHSSGDQVLAVIAKVLMETIRPNDFAIRYGGEEFLVLLPNTSLNEGRQIAEKIRKTIAETKIFHVDGGLLPSVTVSIGLQVNHRGSTVKSLIDSADVKLYEAKQQGRNCVCC